MEPRVGDRPAAAARCGAGKRHVEARPGGRQRVQVGRVHRLAAVAAQLVATEIVGDQQKNILPGSHVRCEVCGDSSSYLPQRAREGS